MTEFRLYPSDECGSDGYPFVWHTDLKYAVREAAGHRCIRCQHPYTKETSTARGEWSPCDAHCAHGMPARCEQAPFEDLGLNTTTGGLIAEAAAFNVERVIEAQWRILTVHHLDGDKANCRWWNLAALCQRCHLTIQGRVVMDRVYPWEHTDWFKPYVAGFYALRYLNEEIDRDEAIERMDELLNLELVGA